MHSHTHIRRRLHLAALLLALCAWFALPSATPARADDDNSPVAISFGELKKKEDLEPDQERSFTFMARVNRQVLIGSLNLDREDEASRRTAPQVTVSCPGVSAAYVGAKIPVAGVSIVSSGVSSSAVFCTPAGPQGATDLLNVTVTVKNTNDHKIDSYAVFAVQLNSATPITLPDTNDNLKRLNLLARKADLYRLPEQGSVDGVKFLLQYLGDDARAYAFVYRDTDASVGCTATGWWNRSGNSAPTSFAACDLNNGNTTPNNNYLVVLNTKNSCIRYRVYLKDPITTTGLDGDGACTPVP